MTKIEANICLIVGTKCSAVIQVPISKMKYSQCMTSSLIGCILHSDCPKFTTFTRGIFILIGLLSV